MDTSLIQELPEIFAKFTEKQKAIWAQSFTPSAQSTRRAKEAYAQDALKMARAMASHPEAMLHAWGHWVTHAPLHAFSLFEEEHPQPQEFTQLLKEYFTGFHTLSKETLAQWVSELEEVDEKSRHR